MRILIFLSALVLINTGAAMDLRGPIVSVEKGKSLSLDGSNYPGFYYSLTSGTSYEKLVMNFSSNGSVNIGEATYTLSISSTGSTAFLGKQYQSLNHLNSPTAMPSLLSEVWFSSKKILGINQSIAMGEGYEINLKDVMGKETGTASALLEFKKDGKTLVEQIVSPQEIFNYKKKINGKKYPVMKGKVDWVFSVKSSNGSKTPVYNASISGLTQYSENPIEIKVGDKYGEFEVTGISSKSIILKNTVAINFPLDTDVPILNGFMKFRTAKDVYKAYAINISEELKSYELRGTPASNVSSYKWSASNFGGMFYDPEYDVSTEWLNVTIDTTNKKIDEGNLVYESAPVKIPYRNPEMSQYKGNYFKDGLPVMGFQGERYAALGSAGRISKILLDSDDTKTLFTGDLWDLGEGYTLTLNEIGESDRTAFLTLAKNKLEVYSSVIEPHKTADLGNNTFLYTKEINGVMVPIFSVYVEAVLNGNQGMVQFKYPLMISDSPLEINTGDSFANVTVVANSEKLRLENEKTVPVGSGYTVDATGDIWLKAASSSIIRFYPLITKIQQDESYISTSPIPEVPAEEYLMGEI